MHVHVELTGRGARDAILRLACPVSCRLLQAKVYDVTKTPKGQRVCFVSRVEVGPSASHPIYHLPSGTCCGPDHKTYVVGGWAWAWWLISDTQRFVPVQTVIWLR